MLYGLCLNVSGKCEHSIEPDMNMEAARPDVGRWVGCLAVHPDEDWMV